MDNNNFHKIFLKGIDESKEVQLRVWDEEHSSYLFRPDWQLVIYSDLTDSVNIHTSSSASVFSANLFFVVVLQYDFLLYTFS